MPWFEYPMKDVQICDKLGGVDKKRYYSKISDMGEPNTICCIIHFLWKETLWTEISK